MNSKVSLKLQDWKKRINAKALLKRDGRLYLLKNKVNLLARLLDAALQIEVSFHQIFNLGFFFRVAFQLFHNQRQPFVPVGGIEMLADIGI